MNLYQGENTNFYLTFLDGESVPIYSGVSGTTIDIYHFKNSSLIVDLSSGTMTQQTAPYANTWHYNYNIAAQADITTYNVIYNAMLSGTAIQRQDSFNVLNSSNSQPVIFPGSVGVSGTVVNSSGTGIQNASVLAVSGTSVYGSTVTDISGNYILALNPALYYFNLSAAGYNINQVPKSIPSGVSFYAGTDTLLQQASGSLTISDTYVGMDSFGNPYPLNNMKVSLWSIDGVGGGSVLSTTFTNISGTFYLTSNPGNFILQIIGQDPNYNRYNQTRNIEVNSAYAPNNFNYGDTSSYGFT